MIGGRLLVKAWWGNWTRARRRVLVAVWVQAYVTAWRAWLGMLVGRDWMAGPRRLFLCVRLQYELADAGQTYGVNVAVTSVDARNVRFDIKVDDQPKP
jgi:hypothetical protein